MRATEKLGICLVAILLLTLPVLGACSDDDDTPVATATASTTPEPTQEPIVEPSPVEEVTITIGNLTDKTGPASRALTMVDMALEDLAEYFNEEILVPGAKLKVVSYDTQYDPSKDRPGYEWLKERGADVIVCGFPTPGVTLKPFLDEDEIMLFSMTHDEVMTDPPGWVFCLGFPGTVPGPTLLKWIAENDWDYASKGPAKVGGAGWIGPYFESLLNGMEEYCDAHPDQFTWEGGYLTNFSQIWTPEVEALKDCDYVMPPGGGWPTFGREFRDAGGIGKFICFESQAAYIGLSAQSIGWDGIDKSLVTLPNRWWNEDTQIPNLAKQLLSEKHPDSVDEIIQAGTSYIGPIGAYYAALSIIADTLSTYGPQNFNSKVLYDTAQSFSMAYGGCEELNFTDTKRVSWNHLGVYEVSAAEEDIVRKDTDWQPLVYLNQ